MDFQFLSVGLLGLRDWLCRCLPETSWWSAYSKYSKVNQIQNITECNPKKVHTLEFQGHCRMLDQRSRPPSFSILRRFLQLPLVPWTEKTSELCPFPSTSPGQPRRMPVALDKRAVAGSRNHVQLHSCTFLVEDKPRKIIRLYAFGYMLQAMDKHSGGLWFLVLKTDLELLGNSLSDPKLLGLPTRDDNSQIGI